MSKKRRSEYINLSEDGDNSNCVSAKTIFIVLLILFIGALCAFYFKDYFKSGKDIGTSSTNSTNFPNKTSSNFNVTTLPMIRNRNACEKSVMSKRYPSLPRISEMKCDVFKCQYLKNKRRDVRSGNVQKRHSAGINTKKNDRLYFVIRGRPANDSEYRHMGAVGWKSSNSPSGWRFMCGSSLISERFALTAAHCSYFARSKEIDDNKPSIVRFGTINIEMRVTKHDYKIENIITHEEYKSPLKYYDIALIKFSTDIQFGPHVRPACLWPNKEFNDYKNELSVSGWGVVQKGGIDMSTKLHTANVMVLPCKSQHYDRYSPRGFLQNQICAGDPKGENDTCQGDSGGPLQIKHRFGNWYYIVGVTSHGRGCARRDNPGVYTRLFSFLVWVENKVWSQT